MATPQFTGGNNGNGNGNGTSGVGNPFGIGVHGNAQFMTAGITGFPIPQNPSVSQTLPAFLQASRTGTRPRTASPRFFSGDGAGQ